MPPIELEPHGNVAVIRLNSGIINAIGHKLVNDLSERLVEVRNHFRGIVLAGGEKFFSLGFDIPELLDLDRSGMTDFFCKFNETVLNLFALPLPTACAIRGHAIAGGTILFLACDYRVAASQKTLIGLNEIRLGVPTPYLADMMLRQIAADQIASEILYQGEFIESTDALNKGIISEVLPKDQVESCALEKVSKTANFNTRAFSESKANRVEVVKSRYLENHQLKNEAFIDCWFEKATQESLRDAAQKSFRQKK